MSYQDTFQKNNPNVPIVHHIDHGDGKVVDFGYDCDGNILALVHFFNGRGCAGGTYDLFKPEFTVKNAVILAARLREWQQEKTIGNEPWPMQALIGLTRARG